MGLKFFAKVVGFLFYFKILAQSVSFYQKNVLIAHTFRKQSVWKKYKIPWPTDIHLWSSKITTASSWLAALSCVYSWMHAFWRTGMLSSARHPGSRSPIPTIAGQHLSSPFLFITSQTNLPIWPVVFFKHSFIILHCSVCDQHDSLVTQASLTGISELQTERNSISYLSTGRVCVIAAYLLMVGQILTSTCKPHAVLREFCLNKDCVCMLRIIFLFI